MRRAILRQEATCFPADAGVSWTYEQGFYVAVGDSLEFTRGARRSRKKAR